MPISIRFVVHSTIGLLALGFVALFCIVGMTMWLNERSRANFNDIVTARDIRSAATELRDALRTGESSQRAYMFTGNEIYLAPYAAAKTEASRQLKILNRLLPADARGVQILERLNAVVAAKITEMDQTIGFRNEGKDADALALFRSNRGKALMDEANVFLTSILLSADERLTRDVEEQSTNAAMLRWASVLGAIVIVLVVGILVVTVTRYTREIGRAQAEVRDLNVGLEERVKLRTADLERARDRAEVLLAEVNHRVANSLMLVASLVRLQSNAVRDEKAKAALAETQGRIHAVSLLHRRLYNSGDARVVELNEYLSGLLEHLETTMRAEGHTASLRYEIALVRLATDASISLGVVVTEWVTNAFKYAYPEQPGEVRVRLQSLSNDRAELCVEDDGIGRGPNEAAKGTGLGSRIVTAMASNLSAQIEYLPRNTGTLARLTFMLSKTPANNDEAKQEGAAGLSAPSLQS